MEVCIVYKGHAHWKKILILVFFVWEMRIEEVRIIYIGHSNFQGNGVLYPLGTPPPCDGKLLRKEWGPLKRGAFNRSEGKSEKNINISIFLYSKRYRSDRVARNKKITSISTGKNWYCHRISIIPHLPNPNARNSRFKILKPSIRVWH